MSGTMSVICVREGPNILGPLVCIVRIFALVMTLTGTSLLISCQSSSVDYVTQVPFDARVWQETQTLEKRLAMVRDLQSTYLTEGVPRSTITRLLGFPSKEVSSNRVHGVDVPSGAVLYYHMGWPRDMHDGCYLVIVLDRKGHFVRSLVSESW